MNLKGLDTVLRNLNREISGMRQRSMAGLLRAAMLIRKDMDSTPPMIPVDTNNLRASYFQEPGIQGTRLIVTLGFTAYYAVFVHEKPNQKFKRPGAGRKFFEAAFKRNTNEVLAILRNSVKVR